DLGNPGVCRQDRSPVEGSRSPQRNRTPRSHRAARLQLRWRSRRDDPPGGETAARFQTGGRRMMLEAKAANQSYGTAASGSSFYAAMRILPREQREAMFQIYSFCRQVDDIADSDGPRPERLPGPPPRRDGNAAR